MIQIPKTSYDKSSDIPVHGWVDRWMPVWSHPYIRLARYDRPIGTWLLLFPCWWSIGLASNSSSQFWFFAIFGVGAIIMRGAGCTINDILDRKVDGKVARTRNRPLPSGQITLFKACLFLVLQLIFGFLVLLTLNPFAILIGVAALLLVFSYPLMKRITFWPQFFLGLTFNWGALLGWAAVHGELSGPSLWLYLAGLFWTLGYDTIYAHQDKIDDPSAGIRSTARKFGLNSRLWIYFFYSKAIVLLAVTGVTTDAGWIFYIGLFLGGVQLFWQVWDVKFAEPKDCLAKFKSNRLFGWLILTGILTEKIVFLNFN